MTCHVARRGRHTAPQVTVFALLYYGFIYLDGAAEAPRAAAPQASVCVLLY
jgi:hypothetical protein